MWCYQCNRRVGLNGEGMCSICNADFVEKIEEGESIIPITNNPPAVSNVPNTRRHIRLVVPNMSFSSLFGFPGDRTNGNGVLDFVQNIMGQVFGPIAAPTNQDAAPGNQMGDFFLGNEDQLQALAERLFRMNRQSLGSPPAETDFINRIPCLKYDDGVCVEDTCSICLEQFEKGSDVYVLPCKHGFHKDCLEPWLKMHSECPSCRHKLPEQQ